MENQKLTERGSLTTSTDDSLIHVVVTNSSFKQTKSNFLKETTKKGGYYGTTQDLKNELDAGVFTGATTYQTLADLNAVSPVPDEGTPAKVANDAIISNNGTYSVVSGIWVQDESLIVDDLISIETNASLSANQGRILNEKHINDASRNVAFIKNILENDSRDCSIFVCSDSTGNANDEWVYRFTDEYLAVNYPVFSVEYHLYDSGTQTYSDVTLQAGTGSNTVHVYNAAISGAQPADFIGENKQTAIIDNAPYDLAIINHGHNIAGSYTHNDDIKETRGLFLELTEEFLTYSQDTGVLVFAQNPWRDDATMDKNIYVVQSLCGLRGFGMIDVYSQFVKQNKDSSLYVDNIHPSTAGTDLYLQELYKAWDGNTSSIRVNQSVFNDYTPINLIKNGFFENYITGTPKGWITSGSTVTKETTIVDPNSYNNYSLKIENGFIYFPLDDNLIKKLNGKIVTYAVRIFVPDAQSVGTGRIGLTSIGTGLSILSPNQFNGKGGWRWKIMTIKADLDTAFYARIYGTTDETGTCYVDRAILLEGELPKDFIQKVNNETITLKNSSTAIALDEELGGVSVWSNDESVNSSGEAGSMKVVCENAFGSTYGIKFYSKDQADFNELAHMVSDGTFKTNGYKLNALQTAPTSASDTGTLGEIRYDANYMYLCTATNVWVRTALTTW